MQSPIRSSFRLQWEPIHGTCGNERNVEESRTFKIFYGEDQDKILDPFVNFKFMHLWHSMSLFRVSNDIDYLLLLWKREVINGEMIEKSE